MTPVRRDIHGAVSLIRNYLKAEGLTIAKAQVFRNGSHRTILVHTTNGRNITSNLYVS